MNNFSDLTPILLLLVLGLPMAAGTVMLVFVVGQLRRTRRIIRAPSGVLRDFVSTRTWGYQRPACWLVVRSHDLHAVQAAMGLHHAKPCSWRHGLAGEEKLFIAPPFNGWILVTGSQLPDPSEDVDVCYRFVVEASRKLGHVQFFSLNPVLHHHAWVQADNGRIIRAYAWARTTVWNQGTPTSAEEDLGLTCFDYAESTEESLLGQPEALETNVEKLPLLADRWSFDPARINERLLERMQGVAGEPAPLR